ncbi:MAG: hypothetical protein A3J49_18255 [Gallionellales bacterium RIFCSPHIGHO2_02_FULL_57_16]|nr:MAG: hypothetical protein A3J49_18255 [Gallionellales bacterium RIFCSPHIGHO2_02_FULL_57_16]
MDHFAKDIAESDIARRVGDRKGRRARVRSVNQVCTLWRGYEYLDIGVALGSKLLPIKARVRMMRPKMVHPTRSIHLFI